MFNRENSYFEGYEQARTNGVPLTELYATAYNAWVSDFDMTLAKSDDLEAYMKYLADTITLKAMEKEGYDLVKTDVKTYCFVKK